jgi:hypothetical protein
MKVVYSFLTSLILMSLSNLHASIDRRHPPPIVIRLRDMPLTI